MLISEAPSKIESLTGEIKLADGQVQECRTLLERAEANLIAAKRDLSLAEGRAAERRIALRDLGDWLRDHAHTAAKEEIREEVIPSSLEAGCSHPNAKPAPDNNAANGRWYCFDCDQFVEPCEQASPEPNGKTVEANPIPDHTHNWMYRGLDDDYQCQVCGECVSLSVMTARQRA